MINGGDKNVFLIDGNTFRNIETYYIKMKNKHTRINNKIHKYTSRKHC